ncbi:hypothetical protein [Enterococcus sp. AZ126]|uniref:hypothetical protein n=1 Tax=Enterococcus sp. AZ126 TaxID=2774635 RepID=UPI003F20FA8A
MANLDNFTNIYADLAQSSYTNRKDSNGNIYNFANGLTDNQQNKLNSNESVKFNFSDTKDAHGNSLDSVYLQPESLALTLFLVKESNL